ncbi:MAG: DNA-directed RNA polymerase subunit D [Nanoarchaeota archaeon]|nr:DNA-directed RNA polymerase subunit D [Nanoarchaeota archaeon]
MKTTKKTPEKVEFVEEISESLANAIRRSASEIPILAIDEIEFIKNDSVLYDEVLALRLGLIPLKTPKDMIIREKCSCKGKGCSKCSIQLKICEKGPCVVYSKSMKGKTEAVYAEIPIVNLVQNQELELIATAKIGTGKEHTKFSPGLVYYRNVAEIETDSNCDSCKECVEACPQKILKINKNKIEFIDKYKCDLCESCVEECKKHGKNCIKIIPGKEIAFFIESWGQIPAEEIFYQAVKIIKNNLNQLK